MKTSPRIYLFHGSDSLGSFSHLGKWIDLFLKKHPEGRVGTIEFSEVELNDLVVKISEHIEVNTLFPAPKLLVIKRFCSRDKGRVLTYSKKLVELLETFLPSLDEDTTILLWEERNIPANHHFMKYLLNLEAQEKAVIKHFLLPDRARVWRYAQDYLSENGCRFAPECRAWFMEQYFNLEQKQRQEAGLRYNEELVIDLRSWWLRQMLDGSIIYARNPEISLKELQDLSIEISPQVQIFDMIREIEQKRWDKARLAYLKISEDSQESDYFGYFGALRWFYNNQLKSRRIDQEFAEYGLRLMGEIELFSKNSLIPKEFLIDQLIGCLEEYELTGKERSLVDLRKVWLTRAGKY